MKIKGITIDGENHKYTALWSVEWRYWIWSAQKLLGFEEKPFAENVIIKNFKIKDIDRIFWLARIIILTLEAKEEQLKANNITIK